MCVGCVGLALITPIKVSKMVKINQGGLAKVATLNEYYKQKNSLARDIIISHWFFTREACQIKPKKNEKPIFLPNILLLRINDQPRAESQHNYKI